MQTIYDAKILIVDDNQDLLNLVTTALRSTGYNQLTACTGCAAAQAAFAANRPDLMILDINLPDGDGFTLFRTLHSMADIPALFLSARDADADRLFGLGLGADDYLTKPFGVMELEVRGRYTESSADPSNPDAKYAVSMVASGHGHTLALLSDGTVQGWGWNSRKQLTSITISGNMTAIFGRNGLRKNCRNSLSSRTSNVRIVIRVYR